MISQVTATTFHRFLRNGRTSPAIFTCEGPDLKGPEEFVVKLRGGLERGESGLLYELYASLLAEHFGIQRPRPVVVTLEADLADTIEATLASDLNRARIIKKSVGLNFGSQFLVNLTVWPVDKYVPEPMQEAAMKVFAFDALIQNPDRSFKNPNLETRGDELFIFDHELAFSFILDIFPNQTPWRLMNEQYLNNHVFAKVLKGIPFSDDFLRRLNSLSIDELEQFSQQIPNEWQLADLEKIEAHLKLMREHSTEFAQQVIERLEGGL